MEERGFKVYPAKKTHNDVMGGRNGKAYKLFFAYNKVRAENNNTYQQEELMFRRLTFKCNITKIVLVMSLTYTTVTQSILCLIFLMCVATMHH